MTRTRPPGRSHGPTPDELSDEQRELYDAIVGGDRAAQVQHFPLAAADGTLNGPFGLLLHAPRLGQAVQALGAAIRFGTGLTARIREIAILTTARATGSGFEWWAHARVARAVGLTDDEIDAIGEGRFSGLDEQEAAAVTLCAVLVTDGALDDEQFDDVHRQFGDRGITELTTLVGYYRLLAQLMTVYEVGVPERADDSSRATPSIER